MYRLATIGALVAALVIPASAAGKAIRPHQARAACPQAVVILPGRGYGVCGGHLWFRDPQTGGMTTGPAFWRHLPQNRPDDHP
jgi:hypothetical protein